MPQPACSAFKVVTNHDDKRPPSQWRPVGAGRVRWH